MNWFSLSGLLAGLACTAMSVWVYRKSSSNPLNILWAVFCMSVAVWGFGALAIGSAGDPALALVSWRYSYVGVVFIPSLFYHFVCVFLRLERPVSIRLGYALSFIFLVLIWTPQFFPATRLMFDQFYYANPPGPNFPFFVVFFAGYVLMSHWDLVRFIRTRADDPRRRQIIWFFTATSLGYAGGSTSFLPIFGIEWYPWGNMTVPLYPIIMTYAIFKHQLMDIQVVLRRTVYYTFFAAGLSLFYVGIVYAVHLMMTGSLFKVETFDEQGGLSIYALLPLIGSIVFFALAVAVLSHRPRTRPKILLGALCLQVFVWQCVWLVSFFCPASWVDTLVRYVYVAITPIPAVYLHFIAEYLGVERLKRLMGPVYLVAVILLAVLLTTDWHIAGYQRYEWGYYPLPGPVFAVFVVFSLVCMLTGCGALMRRLTYGPKDDPLRPRLRYLALSLAFFMFCTVDFMQIYGYPGYPIGTAFFLISIALIAYAILKHELLNIRVTLQRTAIYTGLTLLVSALYLSLVYAFYALIPRSGSEALVTGFVGVIFVAAVFKPIEIVLHRVLERRFFRGTIGEISELNRQLESELERRERLKSVGILAAGMAHEIKNPLTVIQTFTQHLPSKYADPDFREKFDRIIPVEIDRMKRIVTDLLAFSRPSEPRKIEVDLARMIEDLLLLVSAEALKSGVRVQQSLRPATALVDPDQVRQALLNILMNAIDAMRPGGGELGVGLQRREEGVAEISISDTGCGIDPGALPHIFDPFYTNKDGGTGLGLAITHSIIEKHGGSIRVSSQPGVGTTFIIRLTGAAK